MLADPAQPSQGLFGRDCTEPCTAPCAGAPGAAAPFGRLLGGSDAVLAEPAREQAVRQAGIPCTTVRTGKIVDAAGGKSELLVQLPDSSSSDAGSIRWAAGRPGKVLLELHYTCRSS